jgi:RNA polymerase sigma-70 factor (ECF subfamily)
MEDGDLSATGGTASLDANRGPAMIANATADELPGNATSSATPDAVIAADVSPTAFEVGQIPFNGDGPSSGTRSARAGVAAVADLMRAHGDAVLGFCVRVLRDHELAEEVRQQTFLEAFRDFDRSQERSSRRAWLFGIAGHRCLDALRRQQRRSRWIENDEDAVINTHDPGTGPRQQIEHAQLTLALEGCLKTLSPEVRMTVLMRFQTELTYEDLAVQLSTSADALQMRVTRALSKLRRCLESKGVWND